jgi:drug/metabolite transporter (DMT)-like permease
VSGTSKALTVVTVTVLLQLVAAALLKHAALVAPGGLLLPAALIAVAITIHALRFVLWGYAHKRWPLSVTYPMTAVFFPIVIAMAAWYGENIRAGQLVGSACITLGVLWLTLQGQDT